MLDVPQSRGEVSGVEVSRGDSEAPDSLFVRIAAAAWRTLVILVCLMLVGWIFRRLSVVVMPLLLGTLLAAIIRPLVRRLTRRGVPRFLAVLLPMTALTIAIAGAVSLVALSVQAESAVIERSGEKAAEAGQVIVGAIHSVTGVDALKWASQMLDELKSQFPGLASRVALQLLSAGATLLLSVAFCFFLLLDLERLQRGLRERLHPDTYVRVADVASRSWRRLELYLRGMSITAAANALMFGLALWLIGVPLVGANMILLFLGSFIPYVGPILATLVAGTLALGAGGVVDTLLVVAAGIVVQIVEGNVLHPFVVGRSVNLSPMLTIVAVTTGSALAGIIGALTAVPLVAVGILIFDAARESSAPANGIVGA